MTHEDNNIGGRAELPGSDEQKISQMLSGLERVEAPKDFELHLKARLANAEPAAGPSGLFSVLKYALPVVLFVSAGSAVILNYSFEQTTAPAVAETSSVPTPEAIRPATVPATEPVTAAAVVPPASNKAEEQVVASAKPPAPPQRIVTPVSTGRTEVRSVPTLPPGGSMDSTGGRANQTRIPQEFGPANSNSQTAPGRAVPVKPESVRDSLRTMGVEVELEGNTWVVRSVAGDGLGSDLGIRPGDRIEAIDGRPVDGNTVYEGSFKAGTIRVRRGGASTDLPRKP